MLISDYGKVFDSCWEFSFTDGSMGKISILLELIWAHLWILIMKIKTTQFFGEGLTQSLNDTTLTSETKCHIDFTLSGKKIILSLRYYGSNGFLFVNAIKMYQFKAKDSEIKNYTYCSCA